MAAIAPKYHSSGLETNRPRRPLAVGLAVSMLLHALLLALAPLRPPESASSAASGPLEVQLDVPRRPPPPSALPVEPLPPRPIRSPPRRTILSAPSPETAKLPIEPPEPRREPVVERPDDFSAQLEARRAQRRAEEAAIARANAELRAAEHGSDAAAAAAQRNLAQLGNSRPGTGGVFTILSRGHRHAQYAFNGWVPSRTNTWREVIEVDAGPDGNVERAIIKSMIELIRKYHQGNFNWESHRLGRVLVLSARLEDQQGLEDFLMREFF